MITITYPLSLTVSSFRWPLLTPFIFLVPPSASIPLSIESKDNNHRDLGPPSRSLTPVPIPSRSTTPMPTQIAHQPSFRSGTLTIRIFSGKCINLPLPRRVLVFARAIPRLSAGSYSPLIRAWTCAPPGRSHPRCHPKGLRYRSPATHIVLESREHATPALLVASLHRPRIRQERDLDRCARRGSRQSGLELPRRLVSRARPLESISSS